MTYPVPPELYDLMYGGFIADIGFHVAEARAARGAVLEVCCGNGRVFLPMLEAGADVDGLDQDSAALDDLARKLRERGRAARLQRGDMRDFTMPRRYALVIIPFNSFYHNVTQADQLATLRCCRDHLEADGRLSLVAYHPSVKMIVSFNDTRELWREVPDRAGGVARVYNRVRVDTIEQLQRVHRTVERVDAAGTVVETHEFDLELRYVWKPEMELLLRTAGFTRWAAVAPFEGHEAATFHDPPRPPVEGGPLAWSAWRS